MIEDIDGRRWCPYGLKSAPTQILATVWWTRMFAIGEPELENQTLLRVPSWDPEEPQDNLGDFEADGFSPTGASWSGLRMNEVFTTSLGYTA